MKPITRRPLDLALVLFFSVHYLALNLPWLVAPALLGVRVFAAADPRAAHA